MSPRWSCACAPARAVDRGVAEHYRPFDPRPHAPDWPAPPQSDHSPRTDSPRPCEQSIAQLLCRSVAGPGFAVSASHRTCGRRAFGTMPRWCPAGRQSPPRRDLAEFGHLRAARELAKSIADEHRGRHALEVGVARVREHRRDSGANLVALGEGHLSNAHTGYVGDGVERPGPEDAGRDAELGGSRTRGLGSREGDARGERNHNERSSTHLANIPHIFSFAMPFLPLIGHDALRERLDGQASRGTLPASLLLQGPPAVGKQRLPLLLRKRLLCESAGAPCGACQHCSYALRGVHPDLHWFFPRPRLKDSSDIPVEEVGG